MLCDADPHPTLHLGADPDPNPDWHEKMPIHIRKIRILPHVLHMLENIFKKGQHSFTFFQNNANLHCFLFSSVANVS